MGDYTYTKEGYGQVQSEGVIASEWTDLEPLITPERVREIHLTGLPLVSAIRDPITERFKVIDDPLIKDFIEEAVGLVELETKLKVFPRQIKEKHPFDRCAYDSYGYFQLRQRPVFSLESLYVTPSDGTPVFSVPLEWVDTGLLHMGQINIIPLTIALRTGNVVPLTAGPGGAYFLSLFGNKPWIPNFWDLIYTVGFPQGKIRKVVNHLIGVVAAMEILSTLATTYSRTNSQSLSIDGMSQSISSPGPELFKARLEDLAAKRKWLVGRLQSQHNMKIVIDNI